MQKSYIKLWKCNFVLMNAIRIADDMNVCVHVCFMLIFLQRSNYNDEILENNFYIHRIFYCFF